MAAAIAQRDAVQRQPARPDRTSSRNTSRSISGGGQVTAAWQPKIVKVAEPGRRAEQVGRAAATSPRRRSSEALPSSPRADFRRYAERPCRASADSVASAAASARQRRPGRPRRALLHCAQTGHRQPFRAHETSPVSARDNANAAPRRHRAAPRRSRDRGGRGRPRPGPLPARSAPHGGAAGCEMPPAAVERHRQIGIAPAGDGDDPRNRLIELPRIDPEMPRLVALGGREHDRAALAHRRRGQEVIGRRRGRGIVAGVSLRRSMPLASRIQAAAFGAAQLTRLGAPSAQNTRPPFSPRSRPVRRAAPAPRGSRPARQSRCPGRATRPASCSTSTPSGRCGDAEPMEHVRHQFLKPHVVHPGDAFGAAEIGIGACRRPAAACAHCRRGIW